MKNLHFATIFPGNVEILFKFMVKHKLSNDENQAQDYVTNKYRGETVMAPEMSTI